MHMLTDVVVMFSRSLIHYLLKSVEIIWLYGDCMRLTELYGLFNIILGSVF